MKHPNSRVIPDDTGAAVQQALLNYALQGGTILLDGQDLTQAAIVNARRINAEYGEWLERKRSRESIQAIEPAEHREERRRVVRR